MPRDGGILVSVVVAQQLLINCHARVLDLHGGKSVVCTRSGRQVAYVWDALVASGTVLVRGRFAQLGALV